MIPIPLLWLSEQSEIPARIAAAVRHPIHTSDPTVPMVALRPMSEVVGENLQDRRFQTLLTVVVCDFRFAAGNARGLGVLAYSVEQRRREFGIRVLSVMGMLHSLTIHQPVRDKRTGTAACISLLTHPRYLRFHGANL